MTATTNNPNTQRERTTTGTAEAWCEGANQTIRECVEANQKMFNAFANTFSKGWNADVFAPMTSLPNTFDKWTKAINTMVDSNARWATETNGLMIDAMRTNVRAFERTGDLVMGQMLGAAANKNAKPVAEAAREIFDEARNFVAKASERMVKMNSDHVRNLTQVMDDMLVAKA